MEARKRIGYLTEDVSFYLYTDILVEAYLLFVAEEEDLIAICPKLPNITPIMLSPSQARWVFWLAVVISPGSVILAGVFILARRRWRR